MSSWTDKASGKQHSFSQQFYYYESSNTSTVGCSNNYYFRPQPGTNLTVLEPKAPQLTVIKGQVVQTVFQRWNPWLSQTVRLYNNPSDDVQSSMVELEWTVGPVGIDDARSKEVVTKYTTDLASAGVFYTDSNGREYQRRVRNQRPTWNWTDVSPVAGETSVTHHTHPSPSLYSADSPCTPLLLSFGQETITHWLRARGWRIASRRLGCWWTVRRARPLCRTGRWR